MMHFRDGRRARILAVDEQPFSLEIVSDVLGEAYEVVTVQDGQSALRQLDDADPGFDLVILDRSMSEPGGMEILRHIRATPTLARIPVIIQTAAADPVQVAEGVEAGADFYLTKPFRLEALTRVVRAALRQHREAEQLREQARDLAMALRMMGQGVFRFRRLDEAAALAHAVGSLCADGDLVRLGLSELLVNAIEHGNLGIGFDAKSLLVQSGRWRDEVERRVADPAYRDRIALMEVSVSATSVRILIEDQGAGFDSAPFLDMPAAQEGQLNGRGIALARKLIFPNLRYALGGRRVAVSATPAPRYTD